MQIVSNIQIIEKKLYFQVKTAGKTKSTIEIGVSSASPMYILK